MFAYTGGLQGDTGAKGDTGNTGAKGDTGDTGEQGIQGIQGIQGEQGEAGVTTASQHVSRPSASGYDKGLGDLTVDTAWHDLDLSAICPAGTTLIHIELRLYSANDALECQWRRNGETGGNAFIRCLSGGYDADFTYAFWVGCDANRVIEYLVQSGSWTNIDLIVLDYIKDAELS